MIELALPIYYTETFRTKKDKVFLVGMNWYRNADYYLKNKVKKHYHYLIGNQLKRCESTSSQQYKLRMAIYYKNPTCDGSNIAALIEKFALDSLQSWKILAEDNVKFHLGSGWSVAEQDKTNPRCEVIVEYCS